MNFTVNDLLAVIVSYLVCPLFFFMPGYAAASAGNLFGFAEQSAAVRCVIAVVASAIILPSVIFIASHVLGFFGCFWLVVVFSLLMLVWHASHCRWGDCMKRIMLACSTYPLIFAAAIFWTLLCPIMLVDLDLGNRLCTTTALFDWSRNVAIGDSIRITGIPPDNFFMLAGKFYYYYAWCLLACLPMPASEFIAGINSYPGMIAANIWTGYALIAVFLLACKRLYKNSLTSTTLTLACLLPLVGALHYGAFALYSLFASGSLPQGACMEWMFFLPPMSAWLTAMAWLPQHIAGLVCGVGSSLLLLQAIDAEEPPNRRTAYWCAATAGIGFASMFDCSPFVSVPFVAGWCVWFVVFVARRRLSQARPILLAGLLALLLIYPLMAELRSFHKASGLILGLPTVRYENVPDWLDYFKVNKSIQPLATLLLVVPGRLIINLGSLLLAACLYWRSKLWTRADLPWLGLLGISFLCSIFLHSNVGRTTDDMQYRSMFALQFVVLIWAARYLGSMQFLGAKSRAVAVFIWAGILLGVVGSTADLLMTRLFNVLYRSDRVLDSERTLACRQIYSQLDRVLAPGARVQGSMLYDFWGTSVYNVFYSHRQSAIIADTLKCTAFGAEEQNVKPTLAAILPIFIDGSQTAVEQASRRFHLDAIVLCDLDPAWKAAGSWLASQRPSFSNQHYKAYLIKDLPRR